MLYLTLCLKLLLYYEAILTSILSKEKKKRKKIVLYEDKLMVSLWNTHQKPKPLGGYLVHPMPVHNYIWIEDSTD